MPGSVGAGSCDAPGDPTLTDLKQRGVRDILIACVDGLIGFPEAIEAIFPKTTVQTCIVHYADAPIMPTFFTKSLQIAGLVV